MRLSCGSSLLLLRRSLELLKLPLRVTGGGFLVLLDDQEPFREDVDDSVEASGSSEYPVYAARR